jgi:hypothetical protein
MFSFFSIKLTLKKAVYWSTEKTLNSMLLLLIIMFWVMFYQMLKSFFLNDEKLTRGWVFRGGLKI